MVTATRVELKRWSLKKQTKQRTRIEFLVTNSADSLHPQSQSSSTVPSIKSRSKIYTLYFILDNSTSIPPPSSSWLHQTSTLPLLLSRLSILKMRSTTSSLTFSTSISLIPLTVLALSETSRSHVMLKNHFWRKTVIASCFSLSNTMRFVCFALPWFWSCDDYLLLFTAAARCDFFFVSSIRFGPLINERKPLFGRLKRLISQRICMIGRTN